MDLPGFQTAGCFGYTWSVHDIDIDSLLEILDRFPKIRILLLGDLVLDRFILGTPKRISREAPVIILRHDGQEDIPGGGANSLANLAALGVEVHPLGFVGEDEPGESLLAALRERHIDTASIRKIPGYRTPMKVRILGGGASSLKHQVARYDVEDELQLGPVEIEQLRGLLRELMASGDALALSDYGYGAIPLDVVSNLPRPEGSWICLDSRRRIGAFRGVDAATPNLGELEAWAGRRLQDDDSVAVAAEELRQALDARFILATRGNQGMTLAEKDSAPLHIPVFGTDEVADVTGAGDTVLATLIAALAAGARPAQAACLANIAGGLVVMKLGTATISADELRTGILRYGRER